MRLLENHCMLLPKALKMRAIKHIMALITDSIGCTKCAPAQMPWHLRHLNPALLNRQGMCTYPKMENGSELCHWKRQLIIGLRANPQATGGALQFPGACLNCTCATTATLPAMAFINRRALLLSAWYSCRVNIHVRIAKASQYNTFGSCCGCTGLSTAMTAAKCVLQDHAPLNTVT